MELNKLLPKIVRRPPLALNAIFNIHETREDADVTLRHITPNSLAFREGYVCHKAIDLVPLYDEMATIRLREGSYTSEALAIGDAIIARRLAQSDDMARKSRGYAVRLIEGLIEKNCPIFIADYVDKTGEGLAIENIFWVEDEIDRMERLAGEYPSERELIKIFSATETFYALALDSNDAREGAAVDTVRRVMGELATSKQVNIARTLSGRPKAFITYGAGHRDTLRTRFELAGLPFASTKFEVQDEAEDDGFSLAHISKVSADQ